MDIFGKMVALLGGYGRIGEIPHGRIWPDWGNTTWTDMAGLGTIGLMYANPNIKVVDRFVSWFTVLPLRMTSIFNWNCKLWHKGRHKKDDKNMLRNIGNLFVTSHKRPFAPQALLLSVCRAGLFTYIYTKGGKPLSVDVCST